MGKDCITVLILVLSMSGGPGVMTVWLNPHLASAGILWVQVIVPAALLPF